MKTHLCYFITINIIFLILLTVEVNTSQYDSKINPTTKEILNYSVNVFEIINKINDTKGIMKKLNKILLDNDQIKEIIYHYEKTADEYPSEYLQQQIDTLYIEIKKICLDNDGKGTKTIDLILRPYQSNYYYNLFCKFLRYCNTNENESLIFSLYQHYKQRALKNITISNELKAWDQYVIGFYNTLLLTMTKMYSMILIGYKYAANPSKGGIALSFIADNLRDSLSYKTVKMSVEMEFKKLVQILTSSINPIIVKPDEIYRTDPSRYIKDVNYGYLTYFLRDYQTNQKYLKYDETCALHCSDHNNTRHNISTNIELTNEEVICKGRIYSCRKILTNKICTNDEKCDVDALMVPTDIQRGCAVCQCTCDDSKSKKSIRYVNLKSVMSVHAKGYIVTGVRFVIINRTISLQIQQGMYNNLTVDQRTVRWKRINDINPDDGDDTQYEKLKYNRRSFALDDLILPIDSVVIGVKFEVESGIIKLKLMGSNRKNFGDPDTFQQTTLVSYDKRIHRNDININGLKIPTLTTFNNTIFSEQNKYSAIFKQTTLMINTKKYIVPFIDLQDVETNPPSPIIGIGIHLRYSIGSGGFIAPKILSHDNSRIISAQYIKNTLDLF